MESFWHKLPKPFLALAPLDGVTDTVFRQIIASCAKPDVMFTEFVSADGFCSAGRRWVSDALRFTDSEQPLVAQIWGKNPDTMYKATKEIAGMGFAGIDINMGCPVREVMKLGCGAAMIDSPDGARKIISAVKSAAGNFPVGVKTRIGIHDIRTDEWISFVLEQNIDVLTVHGRTAQEMSKVPAHWDEIGKAVKIRDRMGVKTLIVGNGDIADAKEARQKHEQWGVDGVMIGRGVFQSPWAFSRTDIAHEDLLRLLEKHIVLFEDVWGTKKNFASLKKFFKMYIKGFHDATSVRERMMKTTTAHEALEIIYATIQAT